MKGHYCDDCGLVFGDEVCPNCDEPAEELERVEYEVVEDVTH